MSERKSRLDIHTLLTILRALRDQPLSQADIRRVARISPATFFRLLLSARELGIAIECDDGRYSVTDWGIINRRRL